MKKDFIFIESATGSRIKAELTTDNEWDHRELSSHFPFNYGFVPNTTAQDGDPIDAITFDMPENDRYGYATHYATIEMLDNGVRDDKRVYYTDLKPTRVQVFEAMDWFSEYKPGVQVLGVKALVDDDFNLPTMEMQPY